MTLPRNEWVDPGSFILCLGSAEVGRPSRLTVASAVSSRFVRAEATVRRKGLELIGLSSFPDAEYASGSRTGY